MSPTLAVAWTLADLAEADMPRPEQVHLAVCLRSGKAVTLPVRELPGATLRAVVS